MLRWIARGREQSRGIYRDLVDALVKAEAQSEILAVARIRKAGEVHWTATAWWLERRYPERWARGQDRQLAIALDEGDEGITPLDIASALDKAGVSAETIRTMLNELLAASRSDEDDDG